MPLIRLFLRAVESFFFAVNAAAILLTIHFKVFGGFYPFPPSDPKILIEKPDARRFSHRFADGFYPVMLLKFAVKQGCGKAVKSAASGQQGGGTQPVVITIIAAVFLPVNDVLDKCFQVVAFLVDHLQINLMRVGLQRLLAFETFGIGMNVMAIKKTHYIHSARPETFYRIDGTGCTTYVQ